MPLPDLESDALTVFLFGPGTGESIVIHAPGGGWLVVDGCTAGDTVYPRELLRHYGASPSAVMLSHPHVDHARGLARLVEESTRGALSEWPMLAMVPAPDTRGAGDAWDPKAALDGGVAEQVIATILDRWERSPSCRWDLGLGTSLPIGEATVRVLSPVADERDAALRAWLDRRRHDFNRAATALLVTWRGRRILLGADLVEDPGDGWSNALGQDADLREHDLYKIAHHGAIKAIGPHVGRPRAPQLRTWLATPFASKGLPRPEDDQGLDRLLAIEDVVELTALARPYEEQSAVARPTSRKDLAKLTDETPATTTTGFPDCFVCAIVREHGIPEIVRGAGSVRVQR